MFDRDEEGRIVVPLGRWLASALEAVGGEALQFSRHVDVGDVPLPPKTEMIEFLAADRKG